MKRLYVPLCSFFVLASATLNAASLTPAWVELGPAGPVARVIMDSRTGCPQIKFDGRAATMRARVDNPSAAFPVRVCEAPIEKTVKSASVELAGQWQALALPVADPRKIVIIGDTGCRVKDNAQLSPAARQADGRTEIQNCEDSKKWPFPQIAGAAAAEKPDLVIHVGDYLYRETPCPDPGKCGNVYGYNWAAWDADFFTPAASLLTAAPWIFVRGNHEDCGRAWQGFYFFLDPRALAQLSACASPFTDPYVVKLGKQRFAVIDSAMANDTRAPEREVQEYTRQFRSIAAEGVGGGWLLLHHPIWAFRAVGDRLTPSNATLEAAWEQAGLKQQDVSLIVSGHIHLFELLSFAKASNLPPQLVVGDSGTKLTIPLPSELAGAKLANRTVAQGKSFDDFSYCLMTREAKGWRLRMRSDKQVDKADCLLELKGGSVTCR